MAIFYLVILSIACLALFFLNVFWSKMGEPENKGIRGGLFVCLGIFVALPFVHLFINDSYNNHSY